MRVIKQGHIDPEDFKGVSILCGVSLDKVAVADARAEGSCVQQTWPKGYPPAGEEAKG
jgi:hypothetical protein